MNRDLPLSMRRMPDDSKTTVDKALQFYTKIKNKASQEAYGRIGPPRNRRERRLLTRRILKRLKRWEA